MDKVSLRIFLEKNRLFCGYAFLTVIAVILLCCYHPLWQTNDDPLFSMLINGYGVAKNPADAILNCNFLWSRLVRSIPNFLDIQNYTWILYTLSFCSVLIIWTCIENKTDMFLIKLLCLTDMLFYFFLNPQYSVCAAYCAIAGFLAFLAWLRSDKLLWLVIAFILCFLSFIIREIFFACMIILGLFFVPWGVIFHNKKALAAVAVFFLSIVSCYMLDKNVRTGGNWPEILAWQTTRQNLSDADVVEIYLQQPELLKKANVSTNDLGLVRKHFSLDAGLRNPAVHEILQTQTNKIVYALNRLGMGLEALSYFFSQGPFVLTLLIVLLYIKRADWKTTLTLILAAGIFFMIGVLNRGGSEVHRVYYPTLFFIAILLLMTERNRKLEKYVYIKTSVNVCLMGLMLGLSILSFSKESLIREYRISSYDLDKTAQYLDKAVWYGWPWQMEAIYHPFAKMSKLQNIKFQNAGWSALLPSAWNNFDPLQKDGFKKYLLQGFNFAATPAHLDMIKIFCQEHLEGTLQEELITPPDCFTVYHVQCVPTVKDTH